MSLAPRCKAERLAVAGAIAPVLRDQASRVANRRVARVDEHGNVVGYTTLLEVQKQLVARHALEIEVQPDEKPREVMCVRCGLPVPVPKVGRTPRFCRLCTSAKCARCGDKLKKGSTSPWKNARIKGERLCFACIKARSIEQCAKCVDCGSAFSSKRTHQIRSRGTTDPRCRPCFMTHWAKQRDALAKLDGAG